MIASIVVFVCAVGILNVDASSKCPISCVRNYPPGFCYFEGDYYPVHTKWPNKPYSDQCAEYTCTAHGQIAAVGCPDVRPPQDPSVVCYNITLPDETYPNCCTKFICPELM